MIIEINNYCLIGGAAKEENSSLQAPSTFHTFIPSYLHTFIPLYSIHPSSKYLNIFLFLLRSIHLRGGSAIHIDSNSFSRLLLAPTLYEQGRAMPPFFYNGCATLALRNIRHGLVICLAPINASKTPRLQPDTVRYAPIIIFPSFISPQSC